MKKFHHQKNFSLNIEDYQKIRQKNYCHYEDFIKKSEKLELTLNKQFIKIIDKQFDSTPLQISEMFINGFYSGAKMMIEILNNNIYNNNQ